MAGRVRADALERVPAPADNTGNMSTELLGTAADEDGGRALLGLAGLAVAPH